MPSARFLLLLPLVVAAVLVPGAAGSAATSNQLVVTVGPGYSIKVADSSGNAVRQLDPGSYSITIKNLSQGDYLVHDFHLTGPGIDMASPFQNGTTTWSNVTLVDGTYNYKCDAHPTQMKGSFHVGALPPPPPTPKKLNGAVGPKKTIWLKTAGGASVRTLKAGAYKVRVKDSSKVDNFHLVGPGVNKKTGVKFRGSAVWNLRLKTGKYTFRSDMTKKLRRSFKVSPAS